MLCSSHNQKKDNNQFKNIKPPELPENQTVRNYNNEGLKEETFIQRGGDGKLGWRGHAARWLVDWAGKAAAGRQGYPTFECG